MKKYCYLYLAATMLMGASSCSREDEDVVKPVLSDSFPQLIVLDDEGGGELEDSDELSMTLVLADRYDPAGEELGGVIVPLEEDFAVDFQIHDLQGFENISEYVLSCTALFEIDDCTTSEDEGVVLLQEYDVETGRGQLIFPAGAEAVELIFNVDPSYFEDDMLNEARGFSVTFSSVISAENVQVAETTFVYETLDDEAIFGTWEGVLTDEAWANFQSLFGTLNADILALGINDIEEVVWDFEYEALSIEIVLAETEEVDECGEIEMENIVITIESEYAELTRDAQAGEIALEGAVEQEDGSEEDYEYEGEFFISNAVMTITLQGEYNGEQTEEFSIELNQ